MHKANQRLLEVACKHTGMLWVEAAETPHLARALGSLPPTSDAQCLVFDIEFNGPSLPLPRDAILVGIEYCLDLTARYDPVWQIPIESGLSASASSAAFLINETAFEAMLHRRRLRERLTERLNLLSTKQYPTFAEKQFIVRLVQRLLDENGLAVECPTCGAPATLRCLKPGNSVEGCFLFDHRIKSKRTMHGGRSDLPTLVVVDKPREAKTAHVLASLKPSVKATG